MEKKLWKAKGNLRAVNVMSDNVAFKPKIAGCGKEAHKFIPKPQFAKYNTNQYYASNKITNILIKQEL